MTENQKFIAALRAALDRLEAIPDLPRINQCISFIVCCDSRDELRDVVRSLGHTEKNFVNDVAYFNTPEIDGVKITVMTDRETVCRREVVGTKTIPEQTIPEHIEEEVRWVCDEPILK